MGLNNKNLVAHGEATRFKSGDPRSRAAQSKGGQNRLSMRQILRSMMSVELEMDRLDDMEYMVRILCEGRPPRMIDLMAIRKIQHAWKNWMAMDALTNDIDGKLTETVKSARVSLRELLAGEFDELESGSAK